MDSKSSPKNPFKIAEASTSSKKIATKIVAPETASPFKIAESTPFKITEKKESPSDKKPAVAKKPEAKSQSATTPAIPASSTTQNDPSPTTVKTTTPQLDASVSAMCLRAIYGMTENLDIEGLIEKANTLDGVKDLTQISLAEAQAIELITSQRFSLVQCDDINISVDEGELSFITVNDTHLAVITEAGFEPGVKETITLTAERISEID